MSYSEQHLRETAEVVGKLDPAVCEKAVSLLADVRTRGGRLFVLGVGGSAANGKYEERILVTQPAAFEPLDKYRRPSFIIRPRS